MSTEALVWLRPEYQGREDELIHLSAGADLVGVTRSCVSQWAARHSNFPKIVMLAGPAKKRSKWVVREEFLDFARAQLAKKPGGRRQGRSPVRPRAVILAERITQLEAQVQRHTALEAQHAAALNRSRAARRKAEAALKAARLKLGVEVATVRKLADDGRCA